MNINRLEFGFALVLFLFASFIVWQAFGYGILSSTVTGAGFFPFLAGLLMLVSSGGILVGHLTRRRHEDGRLELAPLVPVAAIIGVTVVFLLTVELIGMLLLTPLYVLVVAAIIEPPKSVSGILRHGAVALGFTLFAWLLFDYALSVPLPDGLLG